MSILQQAVSTVMTENPTNINQNSLAVEVLKLVESKNINDVIAVDDNNRVVGVVDIQDLPGMKLM